MDLEGYCKISDFDSNVELEMQNITRYDLLTLGYTVYQMISGHILIILNSYDIKVNRRLKRELPLASLNASKATKEFLTELVNPIQIEDILEKDSKNFTLKLKKMLFLNDIDWKKLENGQLESPFKPEKVN